MDRIFQVTFHVPGALGANLSMKWYAPCDVQLIHVSAVASNDSDATMTIGTSTSAEAYLTACVIGDSGTPVEKTRTDFVGSQYPHVTHDTIMAVALDYDGSSGTAAQNVTIVLTFTEG